MSNIPKDINKTIPPKTGNKFQFANVILLALSHLLHDVYSSFLAPIMPLLITKFDLSYTKAGLLGTMQSLPALFNPIIGSFADKIPEFSELNESTVQDFEENIRKIIKPALRKASVDAIDVFIGSLKDKESIELLVSQILLQIAKK